MVNKYISVLTTLQEAILKVLFVRAGTTLNQRQIANLIKVTPPAVMKALPRLGKLDFIKINQDKETKRWSIELNRDNHKTLQLKRIDNLKQLYEFGLVDLLEQEYAGATLILFGSYSRGEDLFNSDVDLAIIGRKDKNINLTEYEEKLERKITLNFYDSFSKIHKNLKENLANGILLGGGFEL